jgi:ribonuclease-3
VPQSKANIEEFESLLGYTFKDKSLLREALTHASARAAQGGHDNERLEFLGDRVLGLGVAKLLFELFPNAREVELARHFNALVCESTCASVAQSLGLAPFLIMAASEARSGGRRKPVILADACEAVLGAVLMDGGIDCALAAVSRLWGPLASTAEPPAPDAKTALQEYAQSQKRGLPEYREVGRTGADHAPIFRVEVKVKGLKTATGEGTSLKRAQQAAAEALLRREAVWSREPEIA